MKQNSKSPRLLALILVLSAFSTSTIFATTTKAISKSSTAKSTPAKDDVDIAKLKKISKESMRMDIGRDTVYYNGEPQLLTYSLSKEKDKRLFSVHNLKNEMLCYIIKMNYLNGKTFYQINFPMTKQETYGPQYEPIEALIELISRYALDGKITAASVNEIAKVNRLVLKNNVEFKAPQGNIDDIQRSFYDEMAKGKNEVEQKRQAHAEEKHETYLADKPTTATQEFVTLTSFSTETHKLIFKRKSATDKALDKTTVTAGSTNTFMLNVNDEITLADAKGKTISKYVLTAGVKSLVISSNGKSIVPGKANGSSDVAASK